MHIHELLSEIAQICNTLDNLDGVNDYYFCSYHIFHTGEYSIDLCRSCEEGEPPQIDHLARGYGLRTVKPILTGIVEDYTLRLAVEMQRRAAELRVAFNQAVDRIGNGEN